MCKWLYLTKKNANYALSSNKSFCVFFFCFVCKVIAKNTHLQTTRFRTNVLCYIPVDSDGILCTRRCRRGGQPAFFLPDRWVDNQDFSCYVHLLLTTAFFRGEGKRIVHSALQTDLVGFILQLLFQILFHLQLIFKLAHRVILIGFIIVSIIWIFRDHICTNISSS